MKIEDIELKRENSLNNISNIEIDNGELDISIAKLKLLNSAYEEYIKFSTCIFRNKLEMRFDNIASYSSRDSKVITFHFYNCIFEKEFVLEYAQLSYELIFNDCIFLEKVDLNNTYLSKYVDFNNCIFSKELIVDYTTFDDNISFKNTIFNYDYKLNLENTYMNGKSEFFNICSKNINLLEKENIHTLKELILKQKKLNLNVSNRETARIIKDSFEQQNNIIEANKFYAIEMQKEKKNLIKKKRV